MTEAVAVHADPIFDKADRGVCQLSTVSDSGEVEVVSDLDVVVQMPLFLTYRVLNAQSICNIDALCAYQFTSRLLDRTR
jgi:hypothetical protein